MAIVDDRMSIMDGGGSKYHSSIKNDTGGIRTIYELTGKERSEISYNSAAKTQDNYPFLKEVCVMLRKLGFYKGEDTTEFTMGLWNSIKSFQYKYLNKTHTGTLNNDTLEKLYNLSQEAAPTTIGGDANDNISDSTDNSNTGDSSVLAHYDPYFDQRNQKRFRKNKQDINIILGDGTIVKTIKDAYMRSVSVEVDASGNPISEIYEFVARDIIETDEANDPVKYTSIADYAAADFATKYDFSAYTTKYDEVDNDVIEGGISGRIAYGVADYIVEVGTKQVPNLDEYFNNLGTEEQKEKQEYVPAITNTTDEYFGDATYSGVDIIMTVTMPDGTKERHYLNKSFIWKSEKYVARTDGTVMKVKNEIALDANKIFNVVYPDGSIKRGYLGQKINLYGRDFVIGQTGELVNPYTQSSIWNEIPREGQTYKVGTILWVKKPDAASYIYAVVGDVLDIDGQKYKLQTDGKLQKI